METIAMLAKWMAVFALVEVARRIISRRGK